MKAWFVNAEIDRAQICSMTHAETKLLQSLDKQGRANTDLFSSRWGRVGCGVFCMCTNTCPATWTWQHNGMGDMQKKILGVGFFLCGDRYLSGALDLATQMEWVIPMREKKNSEKTLYSFKRKSHPGRRSLSGSLQTPLIDSPQKQTKVFLQ